MASVNAHQSHIIYAKATVAQNQDLKPCNGDVEPVRQNCELTHHDLKPPATSRVTSGDVYFPNNADASFVNNLMATDSATSKDPDKTLQIMTNLDNHQIEIRNDKENFPVFKAPIESAGGPKKGRTFAKNFEGPVSLSKTSSLLREVHQLGEDDRDLGLQGKVGGGEVGPETNGEAAEEASTGNDDEPITYHVLENSAIVKFEPASGHDCSANGAVAEDVDGFDGHTITLVEDENNAGTFKIAEIGEDNTLRVIDNDRIVVFQDESAVKAVCKEEDCGADPTAKDQEDESPSSCITRSMNALNSDSVNIPDAYGPGNDSAPLYKEGCQRQQRRASDSGSSSQSYVNEHGSAVERVPAVQTYADTSIMRPLHSEPGASYSGQNHLKSGNSSSSSSSFPSAAGASGQGLGAGAKTWHYPTEREAAPGMQSHYSSEPAYQNLTNSTGPASASSHPQSYQEYGVSSSSSSATSHGSYGELGAAYPAYNPQLTTWAPSGHAPSTHVDTMMPYPMAEAEQKMGVGYGHPHAAYTAVPPSYLAAPATGYVGYAGDVSRTWRAAKSTDGADLHHNSRDALLYHQQQQQQPQQSHQQPQPQLQQHSSFSVHAPIARPYPTYPGWEAPSSQLSQRHLHYMTTSARGRSSSRINKNRLNTVVQNPQTPVNISSMRTRSSAPLAIGTASVGRPRKRSAAQVDAATASKAGCQGRCVEQGNSSASFPSGKEPGARKRSRQEQQAVSISALGTVSSNVHTLKPGHIIAWYIDYLIHENEDRTQISRAFTLPVNLFHTDDFYFLDSLRKKIRFPSPKFLAWMQCHLPSLNAHAIDFREGRPSRDAGLQSSSVSTWNQDWGWQNKSKRDIIHDVFFYFQHRKAANTEPHQYIGVGTRSKAQLVA